MKVLWVLGEVPIPTDSGARLRIVGLLRLLAQRHEVTAAVLDPGPAGREALRKLEGMCQTVAVLPWDGRSRGVRMAAGAALNLLSRHPYSVVRYCSAATEERLGELAAAPFDVIQCENIGFHRYLRSASSAPRILATHNVEADVWRQRSRLGRSLLVSHYLGQQASKMARYEGRLARTYDSVIAVSEADATRLKTRYGVREVTVVPNGVDTEYFAPGAEPPEPGLAVFSAAMDYAPNDDAVKYFLEAIWPEIKARCPTARFIVVGRHPSASLVARAARAGGVEVTGWVPDVRPYLRRASVVVVPLRMGGGSRLKILEALAMAKPVVSTSVGAEGLAETPGIFLANAPTDFAAVTCRLMEERQREAADLGLARSFVEEHYDWRICADRLERAWLELAKCGEGMAELLREPGRAERPRRSAR